MTYQEAVNKINSLLIFGSKPGLERVSELVERIGSPDSKLKFIHIAGTNGKGSTCALLANTLKCAGFRTGMFISPFVLEFRERFQINGRMIEKDRLAEIVESIFPVVEEMKEEGKIITEFEFVLAVGLTWFAQERCDIVVLETGLGGRFDATNIISTPLASVITSISLDHTAVLGDTYEKIAYEKCGIIKDGGITVAYGQQKSGVMEVIAKAAELHRNRLVKADTSACRVISEGLHGSEFEFTDPGTGRKMILSVPLIGRHQVCNAATALYTLHALKESGLEISDDAVRRGFAGVFFPARLEVLGDSPVVLLDGAHNPGGAAALSEAVRNNLKDMKRIGIVGMLADKDVKSALSMLVPLFDGIITVTPDNPRAMSSEQLAQIVGEYGVPANSFGMDYRSAYIRARELAGSEAAVIVFGSLYLASDMRRVIISESETGIEG